MCIRDRNIYVYDFEDFYGNGDEIGDVTWTKSWDPEHEPQLLGTGGYIIDISAKGYDALIIYIPNTFGDADVPTEEYEGIEYIELQTPEDGYINHEGYFYYTDGSVYDDFEHTIW